MKKFLLFFFILLVQITYSQVGKPKTDLKVGLVLSGGGAKGFAHVGILKVLEEAGVRVDYIAGTSMGAIIGGLYASGYNAHQLDSIIVNTDFKELIQDKIPRSSKSFFQKENDEKYMVTIPIKKGKIGLPSAISRGQNIFNLLSRLTEHVQDITNFNNLPIPFECIATNLETGESVVLNHGSLALAMRASSSFPTLLDPVEIDGKLLTDGGVVNNFPVKEVVKMGADVIIGVDVQDKKKTKNQLNSAPKILIQIVGFNMHDKYKAAKKDVDIYIHPNISKFTVISFDKSKEIIKAGEIAARKELPYLKAIARQQSNKLLLVKGKTIFPKSKKIPIKKIEINGNKNYTKEYILSELNLLNKKSTTFNSFNEGVDNLTATNNFNSIIYRFIPEDGGNRIVFNLKENDISNYLSLGIHYDDLYKSGVLIHLLSKHLLFKNDFFSVGFVLGDNIRYNINYFIDNGFHWSFGIKTRFNKFIQDINYDSNLHIASSEGADKIEVKYTDFTTQFYVQSTFNRKFIVRLGMEHKYLRIFNITTSQSFPQRTFFENNYYINGFSTIKLDTYDNSYYPKKGVKFETNYKIYLFSPYSNFSAFSQLNGSIGFAQTFLKRATFQFMTGAGLTIGKNKNTILDYHLGGNLENDINTFRPFYGYEMADLNNNSYLKSSFILRYELFKNNFASFDANYARVEKDLFNGGSIFANTKSGYAASYGIMTLLGPIELVYAWSPDNANNTWYFNLGFRF